VGVVHFLQNVHLSPAHRHTAGQGLRLQTALQPGEGAGRGASYHTQNM
jgi:hypothetical protein